MIYSDKRAVLQALDINADGYISKNELVSAGVRSGRRLSKVEVDAAFKEYDKNKVHSSLSVWTEFLR